MRRAGVFCRAQSGATAIEFALVVTPFLMMIFGIINSATYFFTVNSLDKGVHDASRQIRTGEFRFSGPVVNGQPTALNIGGLRTAICNAAVTGGANIDCNKLNILVKNNGGTWTGLTRQSCETAGTLTPSTGAAADPLANYVGGASTVVMVTACYQWDLPQYLPFLKLTNFGNALLIQSSTAFRAEPYQ